MSDETEKERLAEARQVVKSQAFYMKRALDQRNLRDGLKHASSMLSELRTSALGPKSYYDLYIAVTDELRHLEAYITAEHKRGRRMLELYELVQHAGNVLPRLYLLLTVGAVYIVSKEAAAKDILTDLVEMCRGVQHPMRGLFLRNYLAQASKSKLPDTGSEYEGTGGTVVDAVSFVLANFAEMNKLWVRMQHQGPVREREAREKERLELRILVGANLMQLSNLDGVNLEVYSESVLPQILEQVVNCKDAIAQQYLMECVAQVFPVEFLIPTLPAWLQHTVWLAPGADVKALLVTMMNRLASSAPEDKEGEAPDVSQEGEATGDAAAAGASSDGPFEILIKHLKTLHPKEGADAASGEKAADPLDTLELYDALLNFVLGYHPKGLAQIEATLCAANELLGSAPAGLGSTSAKASKTLTSIVTRPLHHFQQILRILELPSWPPLLAHLSAARQNEVAGKLVDAVVANVPTIESPTDAARLLQFVQPLMQEGSAAADDTEARPEPADEDTVMELGPVSRMIHAFRAPVTDDQCRILNSVHRSASAGAFRRSPYTLVPVIFACLPLTRQIHLRVTSGEEVSVGVHKLLTFVATIIQHLLPLAPALAMRLHLLCALTADSCDAEEDTYEFMTGAFTTYEEEISDSREQLAAVKLAVATLHHTRNVSAESYGTLATKATQHSARLLKKPDQCRAVAKASFLFATSAVHATAVKKPSGDDEGDEAADGAADEADGASAREPKRVLECLQRSLKIADACKVAQMHTPLFVETLDMYVLHFAHRCAAVTPAYISSLIQLVEQQLSEDTEGKEQTQKARLHFDATKRYIASKCASDARFEEIQA